MDRLVFANSRIVDVLAVHRDVDISEVDPFPSRLLGDVFFLKCGNDAWHTKGMARFNTERCDGSSYSFPLHITISSLISSISNPKNNDSNQSWTSPESLPPRVGVGAFQAVEPGAGPSGNRAIHENKQER